MRPAVEPALQIRLPLVAVRDVQQLHHVRAVIALALQSTRDLLADRRAVVGEGHDARFPAFLLQMIPQQFGLRLLAALIEPFERDQETAHDSSASMSSIVCRRRTIRHVP